MVDFSPSPWSLMATFSFDLVLTAVAIVVLMFIRQVFLAVPVLALVFALVSQPISVFFDKLQSSAEFAATLPWFDLGVVGRVALWHFLAFMGLALGLRYLKSRWLGLLVGATGGTLVAELLFVVTFVDASGQEFFFMGRRVAQAIIFALFLIAALAVAEPLEEEPRVRRGFYVGTTGVAGHFDLEASALGLFFRSLAAGIAMMFVIPAPWIACWFSGWIVSQVRVGGRSTLSFRGTPASVAVLAIALAILNGQAIVLSGVSGTDDDLAWLGWVATLVSIPLGWAYMRWLINHTQLEGRSLRFDGSVWAFIGWYLFIYISIFTIIGGAWVAAAFYRWIARHVQDTGGQVRFMGKGHQVLWRAIVSVLFSLPIVTLPWAVRWFLRWTVRQFELERQTSPSPVA